MCPAVPVKTHSIKENVFSIVLPGNLPNYSGKKRKMDEKQSCIACSSL